MKRVIINGVDMHELCNLDFDEKNSTFNPPKPRTNTVEIPGLDGVLDLTEALTGDIVYEPREDTLIFGVRYGRDYHDALTRVMNFLHGKSYDYKLSWEPDYTYHGRFSVDSHYTFLRHNEIKVNVTADPWKRANDVHFEVPAAKGVEAHLVNRRRRVSPTIICHADTIIGHKERSWALEAGEHYMNELVLDPGDNVVFLDSKPYAGENTWNDVVRLFGDVPWSELADLTWSAISKRGQDVQDDATSVVEVSFPTYDL